MNGKALCIGLIIKTNGSIKVSVFDLPRCVNLRSRSGNLIIAWKTLSWFLLNQLTIWDDIRGRGVDSVVVYIPYRYLK